MEQNQFGFAPLCYVILSIVFWQETPAHLDMLLHWQQILVCLVNTFVSQPAGILATVSIPSAVCLCLDNQLSDWVKLKLHLIVQLL